MTTVRADWLRCLQCSLPVLSPDATQAEEVECDECHTRWRVEKDEDGLYLKLIRHTRQNED